MFKINVSDFIGRNIPFCYGKFFQKHTLGPVTAIEMARKYRGKVWSSVFVFLVEDSLIDTGLSCYAEDLLDFIEPYGIKKVLLTHHHEDHSGAAYFLQENGIKVWAGKKTTTIMKQRFPILFFQHMLWGQSFPLCCNVLKEEILLGPYCAKVIPAPGHAIDQIVLYVKERGWLFSADAFIHERVKYFRSDENFYDTIATLKRILQLDFEMLFCAHRPRIKDGKKALKEKLQWFLEMEEKVKRMHQKGHSIRDIAYSINQNRFSFLQVFSANDVSTKNIVKAILFGPTPRPELRHLS